METLAALLSPKFKQQMRYARALSVVQSEWPVIVKKLANELIPMDIVSNRLMVVCHNPMWMSEIDFFKHTILDAVNDVFRRRSIRITLVGVTPVMGTPTVMDAPKESTNAVPEGFSERIAWNIDRKKKNGAMCCSKCHAVWDTTPVCTLCTVSGG
jgi:hypothetical protein